MVILLLRFIVLAFGIILAGYLLPGVVVRDVGSALLAAFFLGLFNITIKPLLLLFTLPINILTLGLFTLVINAFMVWLAGAVVSGVTVAGFFTSIAAAVIISILNLTLESIL